MKKIQEITAKKHNEYRRDREFLLIAFFCQECTFRGGYGSNPWDFPYNSGESIRLLIKYVEKSDLGCNSEIIAP